MTRLSGAVSRALCLCVCVANILSAGPALADPLSDPPVGQPRPAGVAVASGASGACTAHTSADYREGPSGGLRGYGAVQLVCDPPLEAALTSFKTAVQVYYGGSEEPTHSRDCPDQMHCAVPGGFAVMGVGIPGIQVRVTGHFVVARQGGWIAYPESRLCRPPSTSHITCNASEVDLVGVP